MFEVQLGGAAKINLGLIVVDMQNGFVAKNGSYDKLGMNTPVYREIIPKIRELIDLCKSFEIPVFYTESVREASGIDLLTKIHTLLPKSREERLKIPICVRGTWDGQTIDELKPKEEEGDHIIIKRRDSAFQDTELRVWLQSAGINVLIFCGVDTSICVETSIRDAFNLGYDILLISDATASGIKEHYETTLARVRDYYGLAMNFERFSKMITNLNNARQQRNLNLEEHKQIIDNFISEFGLLDFRDFKVVAPVQAS
ncbi:MAG TPA: isochorismatase family cysteine hydrolase [Nitrososphaeraceae archaeon]|jgi:ureidoacrylate peracid hydrolase|nr:isochorismatase family cysteine hydrolase [Nitrososphaeraceae archaeon]